MRGGGKGIGWAVWALAVGEGGVGGEEGLDAFGAIAVVIVAAAAAPWLGSNTVADGHNIILDLRTYSALADEKPVHVDLMNRKHLIVRAIQKLEMFNKIGLK